MATRYCNLLRHFLNNCAAILGYGKRNQLFSLIVWYLNSINNLKNDSVMKRQILFSLVALMLTASQIVAQDTTHTILKLNRPQYLGLYIAPEMQYGQLNSGFTPFGGASAMLLIGKRFAIGMTAQRSLNESYSPKGVSPLYLQGGFGGLKMEYTAKPNAAIHMSFPLVVGMGFASTDSTLNRGRHLDNRDYGNGNRFGNNNFVVIQPGIQVEGNLIRYAKFFVGASYRIAIANSNNSTTIPTNTLSGVSINAGLKLGLFDFYIGKKQQTAVN